MRAPRKPKDIKNLIEFLDALEFFSKEKHRSLENKEFQKGQLSAIRLIRTMAYLEAKGDK